MKPSPITSDIPRAAIALLLALAVVWLQSEGRARGATRKALQLLTGTRTRSPIYRALRQAIGAGLVERRSLRDGRSVFALTARGVSALHNLGVKPHG